MADFSFDAVSKVNLQEVDNAVQQAMKEILQRFDFKGSQSQITLDKQKNELTIISDDDYKLKTVVDLFQGKLVKRGVSLKSLEWNKVEPASGQTVRQVVKLIQGIPQEKAKEIVKAIKDTKLKVQPQIQADQIRFTSRSKDDLQEVMAILKRGEWGVSLQFTNFR